MTPLDPSEMVRERTVRLHKQTKSVVSLGSSVDRHLGWGEATEALGSLWRGEDLDSAAVGPVLAPVCPHGPTLNPRGKCQSPVAVTFVLSFPFFFWSSESF